MFQKSTALAQAAENLHKSTLRYKKGVVSKSTNIKMRKVWRT